MNNQSKLDGLALEKVTLLSTKLDEALERVKTNRRKNRRKASWIKVITIFLSGAVTILLGLQVTGLEGTFKDVAFTLGAIVTLVNAIEPFFNFRGLWVEHEVALSKFYLLKDALEFYLAGIEQHEVDMKVIEEYFVRYQSIWSGLNTSWIGLRKSEPLDYGV